MMAQGKWIVLESVLGLLQVTAEMRPDLSEDKKQLTSPRHLGRPDRIG